MPSHAHLDEELSPQLAKRKLREQIWRYLEDQNLARFPRPVYNRIPNFMGAETAASMILQLKEFLEAEVVKVNPDSPQRHIRQIVMDEGKTLLMPTPKLSGGFLKLDPRRIPKQMVEKASSISGAYRLADRIALSKLPTVDLIVAGSVAVSLEGGRIGKGEGYSELEYGILRECELVSDDTQIITSVHDCQIVKPFPLEEHDLSVDYILTPTRVHETHTTISRPRGIYWEKVSVDMLRRMPILEELRHRSQPK